MENRICQKCDVEKPMSDYRLYQSGRRKRRICIACERRNRRDNRESEHTPERLEQMRRRRYVREYGVTVEEYDQMVLDRQGRCDICGLLPKDNRGSKLHVDHIEGTKQARGLLCLRCNVGIGMLKHNRKIIAAAHRYLKERI